MREKAQSTWDLAQERLLAAMLASKEIRTSLHPGAKTNDPPLAEEADTLFQEIIWRPVAHSFTVAMLSALLQEERDEPLELHGEALYTFWRQAIAVRGTLQDCGLKHNEEIAERIFALAVKTVLDPSLFIEPTILTKNESAFRIQRMNDGFVVTLLS